MHRIQPFGHLTEGYGAACTCGWRVEHLSNRGLRDAVAAHLRRV